jgi:hypothetical protein
MERWQKSERFTLADPARVPDAPFKPNRTMLRGGGSLAGLALGILLALLLELRKNAILGEWELPAGVVVLGRLPSMQISARNQTKRPGFWRRLLERKESLSTASLVIAAITAVQKLLFFGKV